MQTIGGKNAGNAGVRGLPENHNRHDESIDSKFTNGFKSDVNYPRLPVLAARVNVDRVGKQHDTGS